MSYIDIKTLEISGWNAVLTALHLPYSGEVKSDTNSVISVDNNMLSYKSYCVLSDHDLKLMSALVKRGDEHAKPLRGLLVYTKIDAPIHFWWDLETYRAGHERIFSGSTQNKECKGLKGNDLLSVKDSIPFGRQVVKVDYFSYQCLRNIYLQRENHRNPQFEVFRNWIKTLPYAKELITINE